MAFSYETGVIRTFHVADYVLFAITLALSAVIGLYYVVRDRKNHTSEQYLLGDRKMMVGPVGLSMLSSFISAVTILGVPAEVYNFNTMYWWVSVGFIAAAFGSAHIFIPIFYNLSLTSSFEYMNMRFGKIARTTSSLLYMTWMLVYMAITLYGPALALNVVTGVSLWGSIIAVGVICTFYTTLGGMKAVLWTDTLQMSIMFIGMTCLLIMTAGQVGGMSEAWSIAVEHKRIKMFDFSMDPRSRMTIWSAVIGGAVFWCTVYGTNQAQVQRALSLPSLKKAKLTIWMNVFGFFAIISLSTMVGVVLYAFYKDCDPLTFGLVKKADQLVALLSMDVLAETPGLAGVILTTVFSGTLSTMSSGLSANAAVILEDYIKPIFWPNIRGYQAKFCSMVIVVIGGVLCLGLAFVVSQFGDILQAAYALFGILGGPLLGMFSLGILFPWANEKGAIAGQCASLFFMMWLGLGPKLTHVKNAALSPISTAGCNYSAIQNMSDFVVNSTTLSPDAAFGMNLTTMATIKSEDEAWYVDFYKVSHMWYTPIAVFTTVLVGLAVSFLTGRTEPSTVDPRLMCPLFDILFPYLPEHIRRPMRFGVNYPEKTGQKEGLRVSLCLNEETGAEHRNNGGPLSENTEKSISSKADHQPPEVIELENTNAEVDILTCDSMNLGLVANTGTLKLDMNNDSETPGDVVNSLDGDHDNKAFSE